MIKGNIMMDNEADSILSQDLFEGGSTNDDGSQLDSVSELMEEIGKESMDRGNSPDEQNSPKKKSDSHGKQKPNKNTSSGIFKRGAKIVLEMFHSIFTSAAPLTVTPEQEWQLSLIPEWMPDCPPASDSSISERKAREESSHSSSNGVLFAQSTLKCNTTPSKQHFPHQRKHVGATTPTDFVASKMPEDRIKTEPASPSTTNIQNYCSASRRDIDDCSQSSFSDTFLEERFQLLDECLTKTLAPLTSKSSMATRPLISPKKETSGGSPIQETSSFFKVTTTTLSKGIGPRESCKGEASSKSSERQTRSSRRNQVVSQKESFNITSHATSPHSDGPFVKGEHFREENVKEANLSQRQGVSKESIKSIQSTCPLREKSQRSCKDFQEKNAEESTFWSHQRGKRPKLLLTQESEEKGSSLPIKRKKRHEAKEKPSEATVPSIISKQTSQPSGKVKGVVSDSERPVLKAKSHKVRIVDIPPKCDEVLEITSGTLLCNNMSNHRLILQLIDCGQVMTVVNATDALKSPDCNGKKGLKHPQEPSLISNSMSKASTSKSKVSASSSKVSSKSSQRSKKSLQGDLSHLKAGGSETAATAATRCSFEEPLLSTKFKSGKARPKRSIAVASNTDHSVLAESQGFSLHPMGIAESQGFSLHPTGIAESQGFSLHSLQMDESQGFLPPTKSRKPLNEEDSNDSMSATQGF